MTRSLCLPQWYLISDLGSRERRSSWCSGGGVRIGGWIEHERRVTWHTWPLLSGLGHQIESPEGGSFSARSRDSGGPRWLRGSARSPFWPPPAAATPAVPRRPRPPPPPPQRSP